MKFRMSTIIIVLSCSSLNLVNAQVPTSLSLNKCYQLARENYPLVKRYDLLEKSKEYSLENASKGYLPQFSIGGKATYQSDVTRLPLDIPGINIPTVSKDQYKIYGEVTMPITRLFTVKNSKSLVNTTAQVNKNQLDVQIYSLKKRINQIYFGILLMDAQLEQTRIVISTLKSGIKKNSAAVVNGVVLKSSASILQAELLKIKQREFTLQSNRKQFSDMLALFIGQKLNANTVFEKPASVKPTPINQRPELNLFAAQEQQFENKKLLLKNEVLPHFNLFFQGGYGRPALNMLRNEFEGYYIGGIRLSWNISNFYTHKNKMQLFSLKQSEIANQKEIFLFNTKRSYQQENTEIMKLKELIKMDQEIVKLRHEIGQSAQSKLEFGTITPTDYLRYITDEDQAKQTMALHKIQLLKAQYEAQTIMGN